MKFSLFCLLILVLSFSNSNISHASDSLSLKINAYVDMYFATDDDNVAKPWDDEDNGTNQRSFSAVNNYKGQVGINIAQISGDMNYGENIFGKVTFQYGDLPKISHPEDAAMLQEAYAGVRIIDHLAVTAGLFLTHIGTEALLPKDNWLSSHSIVTYYEPFFHTGAKINYDNGKFSVGFHLLNGAFVFHDNNDNKTFGLNLGYNTGELFSITYAGIYGNEVPDSPNNSKLYMHHNISVYSDILDNLRLKAQVDFASLENAVPKKNGFEDGSFSALCFQGRYEFDDRFSASGRVSIFDNRDGLDGVPFEGKAYTLGAEYKPSRTSYLRIEVRIIEGEDDFKMFRKSAIELMSDRSEIALNFGFWID